VEYSLRPATAADLDYLFNLHRATMRDYVDATWGWNDEWQRDYFEKKFDPDASLIIQVFDQYAGVLVTEDKPDELYLALIEVSPSYQRQGLGTTIITELQERAESAGKPMALHVLKTNEPARRLYELLGFVADADEDHRVRMVWAPSTSIRTGSSQ
jgi:ribosomal protein S18 acetylase RimI-like enzyme